MYSVRASDGREIVAIEEVEEAVRFMRTSLTAREVVRKSDGARIASMREPKAFDKPKGRA